MKDLTILLLLALTSCAHRLLPIDECFPRGTSFSNPLTVQEVERRETPIRDAARPDHSMMPFGSEHSNWQNFKKTMRSGDQLIAFDFPKEFWKNECGRKGYAIVRNGKVANVIVTRLN